MTEAIKPAVEQLSASRIHNQRAEEFLSSESKWLSWNIREGVIWEVQSKDNNLIFIPGSDKAKELARKIRDRFESVFTRVADGNNLYQWVSTIDQYELIIMIEVNELANLEGTVVNP